MKAADASLFDGKTAMENHIAVGGASLTLEKSAGGEVLRVATTVGAGAPEIHFVAKPSWDLSRYTHLVVELRNLGAQPLEVHCRMENPGARRGEKTHCVFDIAGVLPGSSGIAPGEIGNVFVELSRKKAEWIKVDVCGMIGRPWSDSPGDQSGERAIDAANVVKIVLGDFYPPAPHLFEIRGIRGIGRHLEPSPLLADPKRFFPFIDEFGQYIHADWAGKVHGEEELASGREAESADLAAHPGPAHFDRFGGWGDGPSLAATGWFRVHKHQGKWWLVDPDGKLFFSHGVDCVNWSEGDTPVEEREAYFRALPPRDGSLGHCHHRMTRPAHLGHYKGRMPGCFAFGQANLERKYGPGWKEIYADICHRRLRSWGLNTIANWSEPAIYKQAKTPYTINIRIGGKFLEGSTGYWGKFRDVFDADFAREVEAAISEQTQAAAKDPWCLGYFVDNEIGWGTDDVSLAVAALVSPAEQVAKGTFVRDLRDKYGGIEKLNAGWGTAYGSWEALLENTTPPDAGRAHADLAAFHAKTAENYFRIIREAMRRHVPHQLYLGCRFAWYNAPAVAAACRYCDVVSFNIYQRSVANFRLPAEADVPLMIGEFHFGALDRGMFHTGLCPVEDQGQRAIAYKDYLRGMLRHPQFVGSHWFKYMDEPTTGRPLDEENFQVGFVSIADTPYAETVAACREVGESMYEYRLAGG